MDLVTVAEFPNTTEAELARGYLEANGVRAYVSGGLPAMGAQGVPFGAILQVSQEDAEPAASLLSAVRRVRTDTDAQREYRKRAKPVALILVVFLAAMLVLGFVAIVVDALSSLR